MKARKSMRELKELKSLKTFFDRRLIEALGHPVREHILAVLNERDASGSEIGDELGSDVSAFYHHIEQLEKLGCIERVKTVPKRGAREHIFRARSTVFFDDEALRNLPASLRSDLTTGFVQRMFKDIVAALKSGGGSLSRDGSEHVSWIPARLDDRGWREATRLLDEALTRLSEIQRESSARLAEGEAEAVEACIAMLAFEAARQVPESA